MQRWYLLLIPLGAIIALGFIAGGSVFAAILLPSPTPTLSPTETAMPSETPSQTATITPSVTVSQTATTTLTPTITDTPTITLTPSRTPTVTLTPTIDYPVGRVNQQANCRYGPGAAYLYEWGLYEGNRVDVLARNDDGEWVFVNPWWYIDTCWIKTSLLEVSGDVMSVPVVEPILPYNDLYLPPASVRATRMGDDVWISWDEVWMTEDDYRGYLLEVWVCQDGDLVFLPLRYDATLAIVQDEEGCEEVSYGRVYTAEKHGYTQWRAVPWPPYPTPVNTPSFDGPHGG